MAVTGDLETNRAVVQAPTGGTRRSDPELLRSVRGGSEQAAEELIGRHWERAYRIAFAILGDRHLAEDATQESMVSLLANVGRFDLRRPFEPWLDRIVANRSLDLARARGRREELPSRVGPPGVEDPGNDPRLREALASLPVEQRAVVVLRHVAGYGTNEIARILGIRRGTVGSRLRRGLDRLRDELEDRDG